MSTKLRFQYARLQAYFNTVSGNDMLALLIAGSSIGTAILLALWVVISTGDLSSIIGISIVTLLFFGIVAWAIKKELDD